eukprot:TRINITY_DN3981_c0_g1_i1.p1 TRINITY_DN3981_c0_g1~~TRINITY_DN3981_c0_g1_i1.p1  ORF type:complete len:222 (-),score=55.95 TRINITY_DN3981_c0_g1_i1:257-922(-)
MGQQPSAQRAQLPRSRTFAELAEHVNDANILARNIPGSDSAVLEFRLFPASEHDVLVPLLWKHVVEIAVRKVPLPGMPQHERSGSHRFLNYKQFYRLYHFLQQTGAAPSASATSSSSVLALSSDSAGGSSEECIAEVIEGSGEVNDKECVVCMDNDADTVLSCTHSFCQQCWNAWREKSNTCPMCRASTDGSEDWVLMDTSVDVRETARFLHRYLDEVSRT